MASKFPQFKYASDQSLIVYLGDSINLESHHRVLKLLRMLETQPAPGVLNLHPAYCSLLIVFDPLQQDHETLERVLLDYTGALEQVSLPRPPTVEIPVCYGNEHGPDLADLAAAHRISPERVVELHCGAEYIVYFVGFVPGFAYLGGLPPELATPRLEKPRQRVPVGSVAIGGDQTGVYPIQSPGGWRLIGTTPMAIFDRSLPNLSRLSIGDKVRFKPISMNQFSGLRGAPQ
jgi:KipI family sensor histidine kinase inhibitor